MKSGYLKIITLVAIGVMNSGCAPRFIDVVQPAPRATWVERKVENINSIVGSSQAYEFVLSPLEATVTGPEERVIWVAGVDLTKSKLQRSSERLGGGSLDGLLGSSNIANSSIVDVFQFGVIGNSLSVDGQLSLQKFNANEKSRFYVEFLNSGRMTESSEMEMTNAWRALSLKLKEKGLNAKNVVLGGSKYEQRTNSIVLVRVGK